MAPKGVLVIVCLLVFLGLKPGLHAQDSMKVVIISPRVGLTIDAAEKEYFHVFSRINGFGSAQFFQGADGLYYARVSMIDPQVGIETDTIMQYPENSLLLMAEKINHLEELEAGDYRMGTDPARLEITEQSVNLHFVPQKSKADSSVRSGTPPQPAVSGPRPKVRSDMLPITKDEPGVDVVLYPSYGIGLGISSYSPNLAELENAYATVEKYYAETGHPVSPRDRGLTVSPMFWLALYARFSSVTALTIEGGLAPYNTQIRAFSVLLLYYPEFLSTGQGRLRPFGGIGLASHYFRSTRDYGAYISSSTTLDEVSIEGGKTGGNMRFGLEYLPGAVTHIQAFASYLAIPEVNGITSKGGSVSVRLGGFQAGLRIIFYY
jgi:hypothetical protein